MVLILILILTLIVNSYCNHRKSGRFQNGWIWFFFFKWFICIPKKAKIQLFYSYGSVYQVIKTSVRLLTLQTIKTCQTLPNVPIYPMTVFIRRQSAYFEFWFEMRILNYAVYTRETEFEILHSSGRRMSGYPANQTCMELAFPVLL